MSTSLLPETTPRPHIVTPYDCRLRLEQSTGQCCSVCAGAGVFGVEMFLLEDGQILLNEVAPRPHNSGHFTIEGCITSQFEQHLRAVMGWPLGSPDLVTGSWSVSCLTPSCAADALAGMLKTP